MTRSLRFAAWCCATFIAGAGTAFAGPRVVFTFDVESNAMYRLPQEVDAVCTDGSRCGLMEIVRLLDDRHWSGTFFYNVYEQRLWGEPFMRDLAVRLQAAHQDLGLHTHPDSSYDPARPEMYEYTLDEQTAIVRDGVLLLEQWSGKPVVSHRAGAYSADENTLVALERNGIALDSSLFWEYPKSKINALPLGKNVPSRHGRVLEIPVTAYRRSDRPNVLPALFPPVTAPRKIDADWLIDTTEMRAAIDAAVDAGFPIIVVFLHSFSFMDPASGGVPVADHHAIDLFKATLDYVQARQLPVVTMRELAAEGIDASTVPDRVPEVSMRVDVPHYAWRYAKSTSPRSRAVGLTAAAAAFAAMVVAWRLRNATGTTKGGVAPL